VAEPYRPNIPPGRASKAGLCANCGGSLVVTEEDGGQPARISIIVFCPTCETRSEQVGASRWPSLTPEDAQAKRRHQAIKRYNEYWRWKASESREQEERSTRGVPAPVERLIAQGEVLHQEGRVLDALARAEQALALAPEAVEAWKQKGMILSDLSQDEAALRAFEQVNQLDPTDAIGRALAAIPLYRQGQIERALETLDQAIAQAPRPQQAKLYQVKGDMLWQVERYAEALAACELALPLAPQDASIHASRGNALLRLERPTEALHAYTQALEHDPALIVAYVGKAMALLHLGRQEEARVALRRAFALQQEQSE